jgi:hypothetical protein
MKLLIILTPLAFYLPAAALPRRLVFDPAQFPVLIAVNAGIINGQLNTTNDNA